MANEEQLSILKQGNKVWNEWISENRGINVDLSKADLSATDLTKTNLQGVNLYGANLSRADLSLSDLTRANLTAANLSGALLMPTELSRADLREANLRDGNLSTALLFSANFRGASLQRCIFSEATAGGTVFGNSDLSEVIGLNDLGHLGPSSVSTDTFALSKGKIPEAFLRGCGLSDWEIEQMKLYDPDLSNDEITQIQYRVYELRATQALQISPLFISYSHNESEFVDKVGKHLTEKGVRYWRDIHEMKAGRIETQIDRAISQNPTVLLVVSEHSLASDWVEHEVRTARELEKEMGRDVLCPIALDDSWKSSHWPKRIMEQIMEYNILDFSAWKDDSKFDGMFRKLIDGLELFYKG